MTTRDEATLASLRAYAEEPAPGNSEIVPAMAIHELAKNVLALLDEEPVPADEREALATLLDEQFVNWQWDSVAPEMSLGEYVAPMVLAAGFRRQGPITDAMVAHEPEWDQARCGEPMPCSCGGTITEPTWEAVYAHRRAALEAAEAAR